MVLLSLFPNTKFQKYIVDNKEVGFCYYAVGVTQVFIMFFAVDKKFRECGYGSEIINDIVRRYPKKCIITSIGDTVGYDKENVKLRKLFYIKNHFKESKYILRIKKIDEEIMTANKEFSKRKFRIFITLYSLFTLYPGIKNKQ